jgi:glucuronosyltransferase
LNESEHGVVYFSFGSMFRLESLPEDKVRALLDAFSELPQRVLVKSGPLPGTPDNVKTVQWLPQLDVLCKSNLMFYRIGRKVK